MTAPTDWTRWRKCPVCYAETGQPCMDLTGMRASGKLADQPAARPHGSRKPRTGGPP